MSLNLILQLGSDDQESLGRETRDKCARVNNGCRSVDDQAKQRGLGVRMTCGMEKLGTKRFEQESKQLGLACLHETDDRRSGGA